MKSANVSCSDMDRPRTVVGGGPFVVSGRQTCAEKNRPRGRVRDVEAGPAHPWRGTIDSIHVSATPPAIHLTPRTTANEMKPIRFRVQEVVRLAAGFVVV